MEVSSTAGNVLQTLQGLPETPRPAPEAEQTRSEDLETTPVDNLRSSESVSTSDSGRPADSRALEASGEAQPTNADERVGTLIDVQA